MPSKHSSRCPSLRSGELMLTQIKVADRTHATMPLRKQAMSEFKEYAAWDAPTRWFHWINVLAVIGLVGTGSTIRLRASALRCSSCYCLSRQ